LIRKDNSDKSTVIGIEVVLPKWVVGSIINNNVLAFNPDYFNLRKPIERRIYEIARKHCGKQDKWQISLEHLYLKSGSDGDIKNFKRHFKLLLNKGNILEYKINFIDKTNLIEFKFNKIYKRNIEKLNIT